MQRFSTVALCIQMFMAMSHLTSSPAALFWSRVPCTCTSGPNNSRARGAHPTHSMIGYQIKHVHMLHAHVASRASSASFFFLAGKESTSGSWAQRRAAHWPPLLLAIGTQTAAYVRRRASLHGEVHCSDTSVGEYVPPAPAGCPTPASRCRRGGALIDRAPWPRPRRAPRADQTRTLFFVWRRMHVTQRLTYRSTDRSVFTRDGTASVSSIISVPLWVSHSSSQADQLDHLHPVIEFDSISPRRRAGRPRVPDET